MAKTQALRAATSNPDEYAPSGAAPDERVAVGSAAITRFVLRLVPSVPERSAALLRARIGNSLALPSSALARERRLGLLRELLSVGTGEVPPVEAYEGLRKLRVGEDEQWPSASNLVRAYGSWPSAVEVALRLHFYGSPARVPASYVHAPARLGYRHDEVIAGLIACRDALGVWPTPGEYYEWVRVRRFAARRSGLPEPRLASRTPLVRVCGSFQRALALARRAAGETSNVAAPPRADGHGSRDHQGEAPSPPVHSGEPVDIGESEALAQQLWLQVRDLDESERRLLFSALTRRLGGESSPRVDEATDALRVCIEEVGQERGLSRRAYDRWRQEHPHRDALPSSTYIRNTFGGSWSKALDAVGVAPTADIISRRSTATSGKYSREEMCTALRACAKALGNDDFTFERYRAWARAELTGRPVPPRLPLSPLTFIRCFGSWTRARTVAGLDNGRRVGIRGQDRDYEPGHIGEVLRTAAKALAPERLTPARYDRWRIEQLAAGTTSVVLPAAATVCGRFGSWAAALHAAELISERELLRRDARTADQPDQAALLTTVAQATRDQGHLTRAGYQLWRERRLSADPSTDIPSVDVVARAFGGWRNALRTATNKSPLLVREHGLDGRGGLLS